MSKINPDRLAAVFTALCEIDSPSRHEGRVSSFLKELFSSEFAAECFEDESAAATGSDSGNLVFRCSGSAVYESVFFNCHTDTVQPGVGVRVRREGDRFFSAGDTVLGGDDKAGIAILIEAMRVLQENRIAHAPVEFLFTTCEEIGLLGAKAFDQSLIHSTHGYSLDSTGVDLAIIGAPAANHIVCEVFGVAAHAGLNPEKGCSAIQLAARALAEMSLGRLDNESTANIGLISGGAATNIIPDRVRLEGEVRSHSVEKLDSYTNQIEGYFKRYSLPPSLTGITTPGYSFSASRQYPAMLLHDSDVVLQRIERASATLGRTVKKIVAGGGSDANIFNSKGLQTAILGIGMEDVHSTSESVALSDMIRSTELVVSLLTS